MRSSQSTLSIMRKCLSQYVLLAVGLVLMIEPLLPQYHFSLFWFSLGIIAVIISLRDLIQRHE